MVESQYHIVGTLYVSFITTWDQGQKPGWGSEPRCSRASPAPSVTTQRERETPEHVCVPQPALCLWSLTSSHVTNAAFLKHYYLSASTGGGEGWAAVVVLGERLTIVEHDQQLWCLLGTVSLKGYYFVLKRRQIMWCEIKITKSTAAKRHSRMRLEIHCSRFQSKGIFEHFGKQTALFFERINTTSCFTAECRFILNPKDMRVIEIFSSIKRSNTWSGEKQRAAVHNTCTATAH